MELVLLAGVEGGGISLYGELQNNGSWRFKRKYADQTPEMLGDRAVGSESAWIETWEEALKDLDALRWHGLPGVHVHPAFRQLVWEAINTRLANREDRHGVRVLTSWKRCCDVQPDL